MYIAAKILLTYLAPLLAAPTAPDLCDVVHPVTGTPEICVPHEDGAPVYDADVCCTDGTCTPARGGTCVTGQKRFYCELGEVNALDVVSCYFEVPNYCDVVPCELDVGGAPQEAKICCEFGICTLYASGSCDAANVYHCNSVQNNADGTVTCLDWE
jgi:hypothetical protein